MKKNISSFSPQAQLTVTGWLGRPLKRNCCHFLSHWPLEPSSTTARTSSSVVSVSPSARGTGAARSQLAGHSLDRHRDTREPGLSFRNWIQRLSYNCDFWVRERDKDNYQGARTGQAMPTFCSTNVFPLWCIGYTQRLEVYVKRHQVMHENMWCENQSQWLDIIYHDPVWWIENKCDYFF